MPLALTCCCPGTASTVCRCACIRPAMAG